MAVQNCPRKKRPISSNYSDERRYFLNPKSEKPPDRSRGYRIASVADWDLRSGRNSVVDDVAKRTS